jgi:uncharacterized membrane protein YgcG
MEFAGNPSKMSKILASFNGANLGEVSNAGVMENARNEVNTIENNFLAEDTVSMMQAEAEKREMQREYESEVAGIQQSAQAQNDIVSGIGGLASSAFSGGGSLFGGGGSGGFGSAAASPGGAAGVSGIGGGMTNPFSQDKYYSL